MLNRVIAVLAKLRHIVNGEILRSTCFAIFHSHLNYIRITKNIYSPKKSTKIYEFCTF